MGRQEKTLFSITDKLLALDQEERLLLEELGMLRHLNDDAQRDAVIGNSEDRALAYETQKDVDRFERLLRGIDAKRAKLRARRDKLMTKLGGL